MQRIFLTFADSQMERSAIRIAKQANNFNFYDKIIVSNEHDLADDFVGAFKKKLVVGTRGFGYWCWKPQIILQELLKMEENDVLQYTDAGCHLNIQGRKRLLEYFNITAETKGGILAFQAKIPEYPFNYDGRKLLDLPDYKWVKGDLADYFGVRAKAGILNTQTIGAGIIFIRKCQKSLELIKKWKEVYCSNFSLIDDSPSINKNLDGFIEHRHDQAIFSILCKLNDIQTISAFEYWYPSFRNIKKPDWNALKQYPIHAKRDKNRGFVNKFKDLINKVYRRVKLILQKVSSE